jgi:hypothetical protein
MWEEYIYYDFRCVLTSRLQQAGKKNSFNNNHKPYVSIYRCILK